MRLAFLALGAALMVVATVVYASHRREPEATAYLWLEPEDGLFV